jgi:hypothetical protein
MRQAVLFDFHGTLADVTSVRHLLSVRNYDGFYEQSLSCPPIESTVLSARHSHQAGFVNLLFTGMPRRYSEGLQSWLSSHGVHMDLIEMRDDNDRRKDFVVKGEMYQRAIDLGHYVMRAWEDNPRVADLWKAHGIPVIVVPGWDENLVKERVDKKALPTVG